ncbi:GNAT domain, partial [Dillenia turbinata]
VDNSNSTETPAIASMSTMALYPPEFLRVSCHGTQIRPRIRFPYALCTMMIIIFLDFLLIFKLYEQKKILKFHREMDPTPKQTRTKEDMFLQIQTPSVAQSAIPSSRPSNLRFDRLQPSDQELVKENRFEFGQFVAREALLDEEYWTAAWLRAESHWEDRTNERYVENFKRKFADQEFNALKRRCTIQHGQKSICIVTVEKQDKNKKRTVLKSVVGTLDLSIRYLSHGETFPGEQTKTPLFCSINRTEMNRYGYVANLCVAKPARRRGIASNMLHFAVEMAKINGAPQVFVHVHRMNQPAQELYQKLGFEMVEMACPQLEEDQTYLFCCKL